jgi:uncharacterized oxidoreductase
MTPQGNTILITGGTSIIAGRRKALLDDLAVRHGLAAYELDVADPEAIATFASTVTAAHPALNVLINNAGIMMAEQVADADVTTAEAIVAINLLGPIRLTAALLPHLLTQPIATIANVTSGLAFVPLASTPTYSATKAALHSYTQSLRHQLRESRVEVLELAPPAVQTDLMPGHAANPNSMPLGDYIDETMALLATVPTPPEILVQRVNFLRRAEAEGRFDAVFGMLNAHR